MGDMPPELSPAQMVAQLTMEIASLTPKVQLAYDAFIASTPDDPRTADKEERYQDLRKQLLDLMQSRVKLQDQLTAVAAQAQVAATAAADLREVPAMSAFIQALPTALAVDVEAAERNVTLLTLSNGAFFAGDEPKKRGSLYVRKCYTSLFDAILERNTAETRTSLVIGTPGTGKSWWIFYAMWRLCQQANPPAIVWETLMTPGHVILFKGGVALQGSRTSFQEELATDSTWYFCDGVLPMPVSAYAVMVSSPRREVYKEFVKRGARKLVLPIWTDDEMMVCHAHLYSTLPKDRMLKLKAMYGNVPRYVLDLPSHTAEADDMEELNNALAAVDMDMMKACFRGLDSCQEKFHRLLHMSSDSNFRLTSVDFASPHVERCIIERLLKRDVEAMRSFLGSLNGDTTWSSLSGKVYEQLAHHLFTAGGSFPARFLYGKAVDSEDASFKLKSDVTGLTLVLPPSNRENFSPQVKLTDAAKVSTPPGQPLTYLVSADPNYPAIDAVLLPNFLFQMTIQQSRSFPLDAVTKQLDMLTDQPRYYMFYVVPDMQHFRLHTLPAENASGRIRRLKLFAVEIKCG